MNSSTSWSSSSLSEFYLQFVFISFRVCVLCVVCLRRYAQMKWRWMCVDVCCVCAPVPVCVCVNVVLNWFSIFSSSFIQRRLFAWVCFRQTCMALHILQSSQRLCECVDLSICVWNIHSRPYLATEFDSMFSLIFLFAQSTCARLCIQYLSFRPIHMHISSTKIVCADASVRVSVFGCCNVVSPHECMPLTRNCNNWTRSKWLWKIQMKRASAADVQGVARCV